MTQQKKQLKSKKISSIVLEQFVNTKSIDEEIANIINKHARERIGITINGDPADHNDGFFLMWVKKDYSAPEGQNLKITTLAQTITLEEISQSMEKVIMDILKEQNTPPNLA